MASIVREHAPYTEEMPDGRWDGACPCGWESPEHESREIAEWYADEHEKNPEG